MDVGCGFRGSRSAYFWWRFRLLSRAASDRLLLLDRAPTGRIFISVKSRDNRWPFHGFQLTPWHKRRQGQRNDKDWDRNGKRRGKQAEAKSQARRQVRTGRGTERRDMAHRQAEWQTLINTSLWLLFTWVRACFRCYCISPANTAGDVCSRNITGEIWTRAEICRHFLQYQSTLNIITVVVTLWAWL